MKTLTPTWSQKTLHTRVQRHSYPCTYPTPLPHTPTPYTNALIFFRTTNVWFDITIEKLWRCRASPHTPGGRHQAWVFKVRGQAVLIAFWIHLHLFQSVVRGVGCLMKLINGNKGREQFYRGEIISFEMSVAQRGRFVFFFSCICLIFFKTHSSFSEKP